MNSNYKLHNYVKDSKFQTTYGIDKCVIGGISLKEINPPLLFSSYLTNSKASTIRDILEPSILKIIRSVKIYDPQKRFILTMGKTKIGSSYRSYIYLDICVKDEVYENFTPISIQTLKENIDNILNFIEISCGLSLSTKDAFFKSLEINFNIGLDFSYNEYFQVFEYLSELVPKTYIPYSFKGKSPGFKALNKSCSLKFYNKSLQLKTIHKITVPPNILRIEYCLTGKKLKQILGTNKINISDEQVKSIFLFLFKKDIVSPHKKQLIKFEKDLLAKGRQLSKKRYWIKDFVNYTNSLLKHGTFLLDEKIISEIMKKLQKNNYGKNHKSFMIQVEKRDIQESKMVKEIIEKVLASEANTEN